MMFLFRLILRLSLFSMFRRCPVRPRRIGNGYFRDMTCAWRIPFKAHTHDLDSSLLHKFNHRTIKVSGYGTSDYDIYSKRAIS